METRIFDTDNVDQITNKIFKDFEVNQSCTIGGFNMVAGDAIPKGEIIIKKLGELDLKHNWDTISGRRRKRT